MARGGVRPRHRRGAVRSPLPRHRRRDAGGLASLVAQAQVFFTIGIAALVLRDRVSPRQALATLLAASGIVVLVRARLGGGASVTTLGIALTVLAALSWGCGNVLAKLAARRAPARAPLDAFSLVVWSSLAAPLPLAALSYVFEGGAAPAVAIAHMSLRAWLGVLFIAGGATLFGFSTWNRLLHRHPTATITPFALLIPVFAILSAWLVLGEALTRIELVSAGLSLAGLAVNAIPGRVARPAADDAAES